MPDKEAFYITTAIPYANGAPHIGHAYERICTDALARFMRLEERDVLFVTGMDEHGLKMQQTALREGIQPQDLADRTARLFEQMGEQLWAPTDDCVRTTQARHHRASVALWKKMEEKGDIYLSHYAGWYSVRDEAYYEEGELSLNAEGQRIALKTGTPVEWVEEESYFFRLSAYQEKLLRFYETSSSFLLPEFYQNEIVAFVKRGLSDLSISRTTFNWGVKVPQPVAQTGDGSAKDHVMYVWVDALTNYLTATGYPDSTHPRARFWPAHVHVIGKDITRFHAIYWPAFLMSADLPLPHHILVHGFLFNRGEKMSKSVGNVIDPLALSETYGIDTLRYFFMREVPFGQDGSYSHEAILQRHNADLSNDLGNLVQRTLSIIARNCGGTFPHCGALTPADETLLSAAQVLPLKVRESMKNFSLHLALQEIWNFIAEGNRYIANEQPWAVRKTDPARADTILAVMGEGLRIIGLLIQPFMPKAAGQLLDMLSIPLDQRSMRHALDRQWAVPAGTALPSPVPLFPRLVMS